MSERAAFRNEVAQVTEWWKVRPLKVCLLLDYISNKQCLDSPFRAGHSSLYCCSSRCEARDYPHPILLEHPGQEALGNAR